MSRRSTSSVAIIDKTFKNTLIKKTVAVVFVASTSTIAYQDLPVSASQEAAANPKNSSMSGVKLQYVHASAKPKTDTKPKLLEFSVLSKEEGAHMLIYGDQFAKSTSTTALTKLDLLPVASDEDFDFVYADDFDTVDDSSEAEDIYFSVSYGGHLPAASDEDFDFVYADDFDTVDDFKIASPLSTNRGHLSVGRDRE
jgi:hypothetical protein